MKEKNLATKAQRHKGRIMNFEPLFKKNEILKFKKENDK